MSKKITLSLKKQWFDMIASGEKKEEYREIKPFWVKRLHCKCQQDVVKGMMDCHDCFANIRDECRDIKQVEFTLGYPRKDDLNRRMTFEVREIYIDYGNPEWGAPTDQKVFVIRLGQRI